MMKQQMSTEKESPAPLPAPPVLEGVEAIRASLKQQYLSDFAHYSVDIPIPVTPETARSFIAFVEQHEGDPSTHWLRRGLEWEGEHPRMGHNALLCMTATQMGDAGHAFTVEALNLRNQLAEAVHANDTKQMRVLEKRLRTHLAPLDAFADPALPLPSVTQPVQIRHLAQTIMADHYGYPALGHGLQMREVPVSPSVAERVLQQAGMEIPSALPARLPLSGVLRHGLADASPEAIDTVRNINRQVWMQESTTDLVRTLTGLLQKAGLGNQEAAHYARSVKDLAVASRAEFLGTGRG